MLIIDFLINLQMIQSILDNFDYYADNIKTRFNTFITINDVQFFIKHLTDPDFGINHQDLDEFEIDDYLNITTIENVDCNPECYLTFNCDNCYNCNNCYSCSGCETCNNCTDCTDCYLCLKCNGCDDCKTTCGMVDAYKCENCSWGRKN